MTRTPRKNAIEEELEEIVGKPVRRKTRATKAASPDGHREIKPKFSEERKSVTPLRPMNDLQAEYIRLINTKPLVISTGFAGTSKSYIPTVMACDKWRLGDIDKIYLSRPAVSESKSVGFFKGSHIEKMSIWLLPILSTMYDRLGKAVVDLAITSGDIAFIPLETIKGMSFGKSTFVIVDEAEDITVKEAKSIVTRQGGGTMVLAGDLEQAALSEKSGLAWLKKMVESNPQLSDTTGFVDFNRPSDIVRSEACKQWILAMRRER